MAPLKSKFVDSNRDDEYIIKGPSTGFVPEPKGMGYAFYHYMCRYRHLIAQIDGITGVKDTYGNLLERCIQTAREMQRLGLKPKDIITICSINHLNSCVPLIAALFIGAIPACLDPMLSLPDIVHLLKQVTPKIAFISPESIELMESALSQAEIDAEIVVFGQTEKHTAFTNFVGSNRGGEFYPIELRDNKETAIVFFSSGTTGMPKGICLSHCGLLGQGNMLIYEGMSYKICLLYASFYWISATILLIGTMTTGGARLLVPKFKPSVYWKLIHQFKVTCSFLAPSQAMAIYKHGRPDGTDTTRLTDLMIGGGPLSSHHLQEIRELFPGTNCSIVYGQTECSGLVLNFNRCNRQEIMLMYAKPGSSGLVCADFSCKVVDVEAGKILCPNEKGELCFKSEFVMNGYHTIDSSDAWDSDGWLRSGDVGYYDEDRCFYIVDRIKEMLKYQSFHIPPSVIESVLMTHPKIASAVVIGVPNDEDGDHPLGVVSLKCATDELDADEIIKYVEDRVDDRYRLRGGVKFLDALPLTATGKIRRNHLKKLILDGQI